VLYVYHSPEKGRRIHHAGGSSRRAENAGAVDGQRSRHDHNNGCLIIEPQKRPHYSLEELLAQCDPHAEMSEEDREWIDAPAVGKEIL
jgi:antitoxin ChpS